VLDAAAAVLLEYAELRLEIQGHTDDVGDRAYNVDLSQRRAESVRAYLAAKGVAEARLTARGFGPDAPIAKGRSKSARAANRRVEFRLVSGLEEPAP
jgi:OOP family OmpA-OmpF porin